MNRSNPNQNTLRVIRKTSRLLDSAVRIPGTKVRIGLDSIVGLLPGIGDGLGLLFSLSLLLFAARKGISKTSLFLMVKNIVLDAIIGVVPFLGDIFDVAWRANAKNLNIIEEELVDRAEYLRERSPHVLGAWVILILGLPLLLLGMLIMYLGWLLIGILF